MSRFRVLGRLASTAAVLAAFALAQASAQTTVAPPPAPAIVMVDMQQLVFNSKAGKGIQGQMDKQRQAVSKEVAQQEDELQKARAELERQRTTLAPDQFEAKGRQFQQRLQELDRSVQAKQKALQAVYSEAMNKVEEGALQVVAEIAAEHQANLVIQKAAVIFGKDGFDITADAVQRLDQRLPAVTVNQPKPVDLAKPADTAKPRVPGQAQTPPAAQSAPQSQLNLQLQPAPLQLQQKP
ncbi:MAG TPA: OmpH family outer membrane protein [Stellaceae bacterium]|nr:OmpH family outer membrane protein [Stellaceae bacterium]